MTYEEMLTKGRALLDKHGLYEWRFDVQNLRNGFIRDMYPEGFWGWCDQQKREIVVDWRVGRSFRQVVLHEIAHALVGTEGHGEEWITMARKVGCTLNRLIDYYCAL